MLADALEPYLRRNDVLIVFSADLSHYLDYDTAKVVDAYTADKVSRRQDLESHLSCGATGINTALRLAKRWLSVRGCWIWPIPATLPVKETALSVMLPGF